MRFWSHKVLKREKTSEKCRESIMKKFKNLKIAAVGTGDVGFSSTTPLPQCHKTKALGIIPKEAALINEQKSPILGYKRDYSNQ